MANSRQIQITLRSFHLDNPEAEWPELRARLIEIAEEMLDTPTEWERLDGMGMVYSDAWEGLIAVAKTQRLTVPQAKAVTVAREIMEAAQRRLGGDPQGLVDIYERLTAETEPLVHQQVAQKGPEKPPVLMADITKAFLSEYEKDAKSGTLKNIKTACESFVAFLGDLDMRTHTRDDMNRLKDHMMETLKPSTVNVRLTHLNAILEWAVNYGYIKHNYAKKLKIKKDVETEREAFTPEQVRTITDAVGRLKGDSWERWCMTLGAITGGRIGEIGQLDVADIREVEGVWVIDINANGPGKVLKTRSSERLVPLVDGAYGFDLNAFLGYVEGRPKDGKLFEFGPTWIGRTMNRMIKDILDLESTDRTLSYHSFRHSVASVLKHHGCPLTIAQSILGHSSQSITFELYGGGQGVNVMRMEDALRDAFGLSKAE